jgi:hypothetical protein
MIALETAPETLSADDLAVPVWQPDPRFDQDDERSRDYMFDLNGFMVLKNVLSAEDRDEINAFVDAQDIDALEPGQWIGHVETHTYGAKDGINFQNVIEAGPAFEKCIDHPSWIDIVDRYITQGDHRVSIDENFLNVRRSGGFIPMHSGGNTVRLTSCFRAQHGPWMVGQINIIMALTDVGYGDGCTTLIPGSHKSYELHPKAKSFNPWAENISGPEAVGMVQMHLKAGDALLFTDAMTHGSMPRTNPGERRVMIYRYAPQLLAKRFNYLPSDELMARLTDRQKQMVSPQPVRIKPGRTVVGKDAGAPTDG